MFIGGQVFLDAETAVIAVLIAPGMECHGRRRRIARYGFAGGASHIHIERGIIDRHDDGAGRNDRLAIGMTHRKGRKLRPQRGWHSPGRIFAQRPQAFAHPHDVRPRRRHLQHLAAASEFHAARRPIRRFSGCRSGMRREQQQDQACGCNGRSRRSKEHGLCGLVEKGPTMHCGEKSPCTADR